MLGSVSMTFKHRHRWQRRRELGGLVGAMTLMLVCLGLVLLFEDVGVQVGEDIRRMAAL